MRWLIISILIICSTTSYAVDLEWLRYSKGEELRGMDLPVNSLRSEDMAYYAAVQFGPASGEVLYLVFDCEERLAPHDVLYVYVQNHPKYGRPVRLTGRRRTDTYHFPTIELSSSYSNINVEIKLNISARSLWDDSKLDANLEVDCRLTDLKSFRKSAFELVGNLDAGNNNAAYIETMNLLDKPALKGRWDHRSDPPHVRGRICMGKLALLPGTGMSDKARLEIFEKGESKAKMSRNFKIDPGGAYSEFTYYPWKRLRDEREYNMKLRMYLGSFFGSVSASDTMVLR